MRKADGWSGERRRMEWRRDWRGGGRDKRPPEREQQSGECRQRIRESDSVGESRQGSSETDQNSIDREKRTTGVEGR